jgi:hypothetical protein
MYSPSLPKHKMRPHRDWCGAGREVWTLQAWPHGESIAPRLLVVRNRPREPYRSIAAATDFSESPQHAFETTERLFVEQRLTFFHTYEMPGFRRMDNPVLARKTCEDDVRRPCECFLAKVGPLWAPPSASGCTDRAGGSPPAARPSPRAPRRTSRPRWTLFPALRWLGRTPKGGPLALAKGSVDILPGASPPPLRIVPVHRRPGRELMRDRPPLEVRWASWCRSATATWNSCGRIAVSGSPTPRSAAGSRLCARAGVADPTLSSQEQRLVAGRRSLGSGEGALGPSVSGRGQSRADDWLPVRHIGRHDMPARATLLAELFQAA